MASNKQNTPELRGGDLFTAVLPSRKKLLKMFRNEKYDICIKEFIKELSNKDAAQYRISAYEYWGETGGVLWVKPRILEGDTLLLCKQLERMGTAPFGSSLILAILHSTVSKDTEDMTEYFSYFIPRMYNGLLTNITKVTSGIII